MTTIKVLACVMLLSAVTFAQTSPQFEVASIRPSAEQMPTSGVGVHIDGSQVRFTGLTLKNYIGTAYGLKPQQIVGPDWLGQPRFDIAAKIPDGQLAKDVTKMLDALLVERFQLKAHRETREFPVYALRVMSPGFTLKPLAPLTDVPSAVDVKAAGDASGSGADLGGGSSFRLGANRLDVKRMTMRSLAELLTRLASRPVIDETNVDGAYDITISLTPEEFMAVQLRAAVNADVILPPQALQMLDSAPGDPLANALQKVGLTLEAKKAPLEVLVIDAIQKTPTEN